MTAAQKLKNYKNYTTNKNTKIKMIMGASKKGVYCGGWWGKQTIFELNESSRKR